MTTVLKKIQSAVDAGGKNLEGFANAARMSSGDFAKVWKEEPVKALDMFIKGLSQSSNEGQNLTSILNDLGIKGIREADTILRMAGASDLLSDAVDTSTKAWKENVALSNEASTRYATTESKLKILWNRIKDVAIQLGDALVPAVMDAIDAAEPFIKKIENGAKAFSDMSKEQQQSILKMIAFVAAIGPASVGLGALTSGIGGVLKVGGSLASMLGTAKAGTGLLASIGGLTMTGPVGLAVAGVGLLTAGVYALSKASKENTEQTTKEIEKRQEQINKTDEMINRFDELKNKNKLTTEEMLRYMDIMSELKDNSSEEAIKNLTKEQEELLKKSGLTNEEMEEFLKLNGKIVEKSPEMEKAISNQGNAYAETTKKVKELNTEEQKRLQQDTYNKITDGLGKQTRNLEKQKKLQSQIKGYEKEREKHLNESISINDRIKEQDLIIAGIRSKMANATGTEKRKLADKLILAQQEKATLEGTLAYHDSEINRLDKKIGKKKDSLSETKREIDAFNKLLDQYAGMILKEQGINYEKGKAVETIKKQQKEIDTARAKLQEMFRNQQISKAEYEAQNQKLNEQQRKIDVAKKKLQEMNIVAGKTIYKDVKVKTNPTAGTINKQLGNPISKKVNVLLSMRQDQLKKRIENSIPNYVKRPSYLPSTPGYAEGTDYHPGGKAIAGEEGPELARMGNRWALLDFGLHDLPRGTQVFTHDETKRILNALNRIPTYANGVSQAGEVDRIINRLNKSEINEGEPVVIELHITNNMDGRAVGEVVEKHVTRIQQRKQFRQRRLSNA